MATFGWGSERVAGRTTLRIFFPFSYFFFFFFLERWWTRQAIGFRFNPQFFFCLYFIYIFYFCFYFILFFLMFAKCVEGAIVSQTWQCVAQTRKHILSCFFFFFLLVGISVFFPSFPCRTTPHIAGRCILHAECRLTLVWRKCHKTYSAMICTEEYRCNQSNYTILEIVGLFLYNTKAIWKPLNSKLVNCTTKTHFI